MKVYNLLLKLIEKNYYEKEVIVNKINFFFAMSQINEEEYSTLMLKVDEIYIETVEDVESTEETSTEEVVE